MFHVPPGLVQALRPSDVALACRGLVLSDALRVLHLDVRDAVVTDISTSFENLWPCLGTIRVDLRSSSHSVQEARVLHVGHRLRRRPSLRHAKQI